MRTVQAPALQFGGSGGCRLGLFAAYCRPQHVACHRVEAVPIGEPGLHIGDVGLTASNPSGARAPNRQRLMLISSPGS